MSEDFNHWDQIAEQFDKATKQVVKKTAFDIQAGYQQRAHVDTGFMKNSAYVATSDSSNYGQATPTKKGAYLLPEEKPEDEHTAIVGVGANYAIVEEFGGANNHPAHPALIPAAEAARGPFEAALAAIEDKLREVGG